MKRPLVSAVILSFNRKDETLECLSALGSQTYSNLELVVLDNASTDGSAEAIAERFPDCTLIRMPRNYGDWEGRDIAACNCSGKYLLIVDSDAVIGIDCIEKLVERIEREPEVAVIQPKITDTETGTAYNMGFGRARVDEEFYRPTFHGCTALIRMKPFRAAGGFPHYLLGGGERFLSYRLLDIGYRILYYPSVMISHSMSRKERVPHQRYLLQSLQDIRGRATLYPSILRLLLDACWKLPHYVAGAVRRGYWHHAPLDVLILLHGIARGLRERKPMRRETLNLADHLSAHMVATESDYAAIDTSRGYLRHYLRRRFCRSSVGPQVVVGADE